MASPRVLAVAGTFLLGVGCQKGGTAWMHRYLEASPQCDPGFRKEYHVWDALDLPAGRLARERIEKQGGQRAAFLHEPEPLLRLLHRAARAARRSG